MELGLISKMVCLYAFHPPQTHSGFICNAITISCVVIIVFHRITNELEPPAAARADICNVSSFAMSCIPSPGGLAPPELSQPHVHRLEKRTMPQRCGICVRCRPLLTLHTFGLPITPASCVVVVCISDGIRPSNSHFVCSSVKRSFQTR